MWQMAPKEMVQSGMALAPLVTTMETDKITGRNDN